MKSRPLLDSLRRHFYRAALLGVACFLVGAVVGPATARAEVVGGVQLPDGVQKVGENRYRAPQSWEETLKYFKTTYPPQAFPRRTIVHQPGVQAIHIVNPAAAKGFEGLNIYETANGEVRIFIVPKEGLHHKAAGKTPRKPKK